MYKQILPVIVMAMALLGCNGDGSRNPTAEHAPGGGDTNNTTIIIGGGGNGPLPESFDYIQAVPHETQNGFFEAALPVGEEIMYSVFGYRDGEEYDVTRLVSIEADALLEVESDPVGRIRATGLSVGESEIEFRLDNHSVQRVVTLVDAQPLGLIIESDSSVIRIGLPNQLKSYLLYTDGAEQDVTASSVWESSDENTLTVTAGGLAQGQIPGEVIVSANHPISGFEAQVDLAVEFDPLVSLSMSSLHSELDLGQQTSLVVEATFQSGAMADVSKWATYSVLTPSILEMGEVDVASVIGISNGTGRVDALFGGLVANPVQLTVSSDVYVPPDEPTLVSFEVSPARSIQPHFESAVPVGQYFNYVALAIYDDGSKVDVTADTDIVAYDSSSLHAQNFTTGKIAVMPLKVQKYPISFEYKGEVFGRELTAVDKVAIGLEVTPQVDTLAINQGVYLGLNVLFSDASKERVFSPVVENATPTVISYEDGVVKAIGGGAGLVRVSAVDYPSLGTVQKEITVTEHLIESISLSPVSVETQPGGEFQLSVRGIYSSGKTTSLNDVVSYDISGDSIVFNTSTRRFEAVEVGYSMVTATYQGIESNAVGVNVKDPSSTLPPTCPDGDCGGTNPPVDVELVGITVTPKTTLYGYTESKLPLGESLEYIVYARYDNGTREVVTNEASISSRYLDISTDTVGRAFVHATSIGVFAVDFEYEGYTVTRNVNVVSIEPIRLEVTGSDSGLLPKGKQYQLRAWLRYSDGSRVDVASQSSWTSSDDLFASVSQSGRVTGLSEGNVTISLSTGIDGFESLSVPIVVTQPSLETLTLTLSETYLQIGDVSTAKVVGLYSDGLTVDITKDADVNYDVDGVVSNASNHYELAGLGKGQVNVWARFLDVSSDVVPLRVNDDPIELLTVNVDKGVVSVGESGNFEVLAHFTDTSVRDVTRYASVVSSDPSLMAIRGGYTFEGRDVGTASIMVEYQGHVGQQTVGISEAEITGLSISPTTVKVTKGAMAEVKAYVHYSDGKKFEISNVALWSAAFPSIAYVEAGEVSGLEVGSTPIKVTHSGFDGSASATIIVEDIDEVDPGATPPVGDVFDVHLGDDKQIKFLLRLGNGQMVNVTEDSTWRVEDPSIGSISEAGLYSPIVMGTTKVFADLEDGSGNLVATYEATINNLAARLVGIHASPAAVVFQKGKVVRVNQLDVFSDGTTLPAATMHTCAAGDTSLTKIAAKSTDGWHLEVSANRHPGIDTIVCTYNGFETTIDVDVESPAVASVEISSRSHVDVNDMARVDYRVSYIDGSEVSKVDGVLLTVQDGEGYFNADGLLESLVAGKVSVRAQYEGINSNEVTVEFMTPASFKKVRCVYFSCFGLHEDGYMYGVGRNSFYMFGSVVGDNADLDFWTRLWDGGVIDFAVVYGYVFVLDDNGNVYVTGKDYGTSRYFGSIPQEYVRANLPEPIVKLVSTERLANVTAGMGVSTVYAIGESGALYAALSNNGTDPKWGADFDANWRVIDNNVVSVAGSGYESSYASTNFNLHGDGPMLVLKTDGAAYHHDELVMNNVRSVSSNAFGGNVILETNDRDFYFYGRYRKSQTTNSCLDMKGSILFETAEAVECASNYLMKIDAVDLGLSSLDYFQQAGLGAFFVKGDGRNFMYSAPLYSIKYSLAGGGTGGSEAISYSLEETFDDFEDVSLLSGESIMGRMSDGTVKHRSLNVDSSAMGRLPDERLFKGNENPSVKTYLAN
ncbi:Ig-like domain-containing protein [Vibrio mediterranei]|uniref:Ig-like domain-containing protein n=1 Tax=Vibrio mediterranei TaxID=689 RepID=UPI0040678DFA